MSTLYLIRHGQASFGQENYDQLSELGHAQAQRAGRALSQRIPQFDAVVLGTMHRHRQTAEAFFEEYGHSLDTLNPGFDAGWNEYDHQDILAQLRPELATAASTQQYVAAQPNPKQAFEQIFNDAIDRWIRGEHDEDYIESWAVYHQRVTAALKNIIKQHAQVKNIAVFTSGGPISLVAQSLLGVPAERIMQLNWTLVNCGITKLVATGSRTFVASLNEHAHFEGEDKSFITYK